jgi:hypothetical protein
MQLISVQQHCLFSLKFFAVIISTICNNASSWLTSNHRAISFKEFNNQTIVTHQGSFVPVHLQSYLEEYTFRFNRRTSGSRGLVFRRLIEQAMVTGPVTRNDVTFGYNWKKSQAGGAN